MTFSTKTTYTQKPIRLALQSWGAADQCAMSQVPISTPWHREYNWKHTWNHTVLNHPIHQHGHTNFWYVYLLERVYFNSKNAAIMCGMYIINRVHGPEPWSSGGNTSSNPQVSALIPRPAFNGMERMYQRHGSNQNSHPHVLVRKPLCTQFIHYHISSRRVFGINRFELCNFAVVAIECSFATVYRGSIMGRIHRWSVMKSGIPLNKTYCESLTHCGLVMPYDVWELVQLWLRQWFVAWRHIAITWSSANFTRVRSSDIHIMAISLQPSLSHQPLQLTWKLPIQIFCKSLRGQRIKKLWQWQYWVHA